MYLQCNSSNVFLLLNEMKLINFGITSKYFHNIMATQFVTWQKKSLCSIDQVLHSNATELEVWSTDYLVRIIEVILNY